VSGKAKVTLVARKNEHQFAGDITTQLAWMEQLSGNKACLNEAKSSTLG